MRNLAIAGLLATVAGMAWAQQPLICHAGGREWAVAVNIVDNFGWGQTTVIHDLDASIYEQIAIADEPPVPISPFTVNLNPDPAEATWRLTLTTIPGHQDPEGCCHLIQMEATTTMTFDIEAPTQDVPDREIWLRCGTPVEPVESYILCQAVGCPESTPMRRETWLRRYAAEHCMFVTGLPPQYMTSGEEVYRNTLGQTFYSPIDSLNVEDPRSLELNVPGMYEDGAWVTVRNNGFELIDALPTWGDDQTGSVTVEITTDWVYLFDPICPAGAGTPYP